MPKLELIEERQENSKTFNLGGRERQLALSMGAVHYKDDYASNEPWKDIDLTWEGNKITKAPYQLTLDGKKLTIKNKKTGEVSTIELMEIGGKVIPPIAWQVSKGLAKVSAIARDTDLEVTVENSSVRFRRILKSDKAPLEAKFQVTGNFTVSAQDEEDELPVESSLSGGVLTETLKPNRTIKYPVRIDPVWQPTAGTDDVGVDNDGTSAPYWNLAYALFRCGYLSAAYTDFSSAARFLNFTIPGSATINTARLTLTCQTALSDTVVNTRIRAERNINPATFTDKANFDARTWTTEYINWDGIEAWSLDAEYDSPDFASVIQEVIDLASWASGNPIVILWDDFQNRSTQSGNANRQAHSWDGSTTLCPQLVITYTVPGESIARQVEQSSDDCYRRLNPSTWELTVNSQIVGGILAQYQFGGGMRFTNITIPQNATIEDGTHLILTCQTPKAGGDCKSRISAEDVDDAPTFADDSGAFDTRWAARTTARVDWDSIGEWFLNVEYTSPEIKTVIQEIVNRGGWASGQDIVIFWDDFDERSSYDNDSIRYGYSYDGSTARCAQLVVVFSNPVPAGLENKTANMGAKLIAGKLI